MKSVDFRSFKVRKYIDYFKEMKINLNSQLVQVLDALFKKRHKALNNYLANQTF